MREQSPAGVAAPEVQLPAWRLTVDPVSATADETGSRRHISRALEFVAGRGEPIRQSLKVEHRARALAQVAENPVSPEYIGFSAQTRRRMLPVLLFCAGSWHGASASFIHDKAGTARSVHRLARPCQGLQYHHSAGVAHLETAADRRPRYCFSTLPGSAAGPLHDVDNPSWLLSFASCDLAGLRRRSGSEGRDRSA